MKDIEIFLMDMKLMFLHGKNHALLKTRFDRRLVIHHIHYVVEQILREKLKDTEYKDKGFKDLIKIVHKKQNIRDYDRLLNLNTMRNNAEHHNIVASQEDVDFHVKIVEDFLKWSYKYYFNEDYESLNLVDFISDNNIKIYLEKAQELLKQNKDQEALTQMYQGLGNFRTKIFNFFRLRELKFIKFGGITFGDIFGHNNLKLLFFRNLIAMAKFNRMQYTKIEEKKGETYFEWKYNFDGIKDAKKEFDEVLNIVLSFQDQFPF